MIAISIYNFFFNFIGPKDSQDVDGDTYKPIASNSYTMDLHLELIQAQHRIAVVLLDQLEGSGHPQLSQNPRVDLIKFCNCVFVAHVPNEFYYFILFSSD